jgi:hypothetical protein
MSDRETTRVLVSVAIVIWGIGILLIVVLWSAWLLTSDFDLLADAGPGGEGPNWAEITLALWTVVLAIATCALAVGAFLALGGLKESRRDRNVTAMTDMSRRWDDDHFRDVRRKIQDYAGQEVSSRKALKDKVVQLRESNDPEYRELLTEPSFLEDLSILVKYEGIDFEIVKDSLGYIVWDRWCLWQPTIDELRGLRNEPSVFEYFQYLAERIKSDIPRLPDLASWDGPKY